MTPQEKQRLKARFFGLHIGCDVIISDSLFLEGRHKLTGIDMNDAGVQLLFRYQPIWDLGNCNLVLRPLSSITDEEAIECAKIANENTYHNVRRYDGWIAVENEMVGEWDVYIGLGNVGVWGQDGSSLKNDISAYDWLRSKHFCLPFCGLDPIAEGWAILESANQQNAVK